MTLADVVDEYLSMHQAEPVTAAKLRWLLGKATATLGAVRVADLSPKAIYAWRQTVPEGHRFEATQALRQLLSRAVEWEWLSDNPAKRVPNSPRRSKEKRPFESWHEIEAVADELGPAYGALVIFAAATGLRPSELFGLERSDIDREAGVVYVRRAFANGRLKQTKTRLSNRAVPLQAKALEALEQLPRQRTRSCSRIREAAASTSAVSGAGTGSRLSGEPVSSRCAASTTCAIPMRPSPCAQEYRCLPFPGSWARVSR